MSVIKMSLIDFQIPNKMSVNYVDDFHGEFIIKPLEKGYGITLGNTLRRVILSSLEGYAITSLRIPGVAHEFSTIKGVAEDLVEIILNLKQVRIKRVLPLADNKLFIAVSNKNVLTAGDLVHAGSAFTITNPDLIICRLDETAHFEMELTVEKGRGYIPAEENMSETQLKGIIPIDAIFTPIKKVEYQVENIRVGQKIDYESLILTVQTDGTIHPQAAIEAASNIMMKHFSLLVDKEKLVREKEGDGIGILDQPMLQMRKLLKARIDENLGLTARARNCLTAVGMQTLGDIVCRKEEELLGIKNLGDKTVDELKKFLSNKGLKFGMNVTPYNL